LNDTVHDFRARDIGVQEVQSVKPLWEALNALHGQRTPHFAAVFEAMTFEARMAPILEYDANDIKISLIENREGVCGYCVSTIAGQTGEIHSLYVQEAERNRHMGRTLVLLHQKWFDERNCTSVKLDVVFGNQSVIGFYRKLGFFEFTIELRRISSSSDSR
jgi:diamine N-acetyltransferase